MAKKQKSRKLLPLFALLALLFIPIANASANTVQVKVNVKAVADVSVSSEEIEGKIVYTATVRTNSTNGYDLYVSSDDGKTYSLLKTVEKYPSDEERVVTATSTNDNLKFKVNPRQ